MSAVVIGQATESLTWFLGNTFALAVWWLICGAVSGVFLALFGGTVTFMLTGSFQSQKQTARVVGTLGGAVLGLVGGATVGRIGDFGGLVGMVYLWAFVGMLYAAFLGIYVPRTAEARFDEDWETPEGDGLADRAVSLLDEVSSTFSRSSPSESRSDEIAGIVCGAIVGLFYGIVTALLIPLSASRLPVEDPARTVIGAAVIWALFGGFGAWVGSRRIGVYGGMVTVITGLLAGSALGGMIALAGQVFGDFVCGAISGAIGGAFFGSLAAVEMINRRIK